MNDNGSNELRVERRSFNDADAARDAYVREDDLEPHAGLRYIAWLFKILAILLVLVLIAEVVIGLQRRDALVMSTLMVEATRLVVFASFLWAAGDMALMLIESNHDLRATRIMVSRLTAKHVEKEPPVERRPPTT